MADTDSADLYSRARLLELECAHSSSLGWPLELPFKQGPGAVGLRTGLSVARLSGPTFPRAGHGPFVEESQAWCSPKGVRGSGVEWKWPGCISHRRGKHYFGKL